MVKALLLKFVQWPLVRVSLTIVLNLFVVFVVIAWLYSLQNRLVGEWHWRQWAICLHVDHNGYYVSILPPRDKFPTAYYADLQLKPNERDEPTQIESNLELEQRRLILPGLGFWWSTTPTDPFDRISARGRHGLLFCFAVSLRWLLFWYFRRQATQTRPEFSDPVPTP